jgi:hypothetical protein
MTMGAFVPVLTVEFQTGLFTEQTKGPLCCPGAGVGAALIADWSEPLELNEVPPPGLSTVLGPTSARTTAAVWVGP